jgi:opacity protein-like surface antigen
MKAKTRTATLLLTILAGVMCAALPAAAEWNIDLYGGASWTQSADFQVRGKGDASGTQLTIFDIGADTGFTFGLRSGYWFDSIPFLGLDLDVFYVHTSVPSQSRTGTATFTGEFNGKPISVSASGEATIPSITVPLFGFAPEVRLRWPLMVDNTFRAGRLQPYLSGGPAWAFSLDSDSVDVELGGKFGGGVSYNITPTIALFGEYRYLFFPDFKLTSSNFTYTVDIFTHSAIAGISFRF